MATPPRQQGNTRELWHNATMRYAARRDGTHAEVRDALREQGWKVKDCGRFGDDFPDLIARHPRMGDLGVFLIEVKSRKGKLNAGQTKFADDFPVEVIRTKEAALEFHARAFALWCHNRRTDGR